MDTVKYKKEAEEIDDSFLHLEEVDEDEESITYVFRWVVRDYIRIVAGIHYRCHCIRIDNTIHNLRIFKHDTKLRDLREKKVYWILLGLTPPSSCANISIFLIGHGNKEIRPEDGRMQNILDRKCFYAFPESRMSADHLDLVSLCKITVPKTARVSVGIENGTFHEDFERFYGNGFLSDVKLCVGEREFDAHKVVLAARSPVFAAMLRNNMKENSENRIEIEDSNEKAVGELLRYLYVEKTVPLKLDLALDLFELADKYDIATLKLETSNYLRCNFSTDNILDILVAADLHDDKQMKKEAIEFIANNLWFLLKKPKWKIFRTRVELVDCILAYLSL